MKKLRGTLPDITESERIKELEELMRRVFQKIEQIEDDIRTVDDELTDVRNAFSEFDEKGIPIDLLKRVNIIEKHFEYYKSDWSRLGENVELLLNLPLVVEQNRILVQEIKDRDAKLFFTSKKEGFISYLIRKLQGWN